mmetsp:Transcript_136012/g.240410  ORF Transcript_136012/g.240410 Transcript_136012/m.240410 type:complete len:222 (-) Transcript_136012:137-802(-)
MGMAAGGERLTEHETMCLHRELNAWMKKTRYQPDEVEKRPVYQFYNTTMTLSVASGIAVFYAQRRWLSNYIRGVPVSLILPAAAYFAAQGPLKILQLPTLYRSVLALPTPLGMKAQECLAALRAEDGSIASSTAVAQAISSVPKPDVTASDSFGWTSEPLNLDVSGGSAAWPDFPWPAQVCEPAAQAPVYPARRIDRRSVARPRPPPTTWEEIRSRHAGQS